MQKIIQYLTDNIEGKNSDISELLGLSLSRARAILSELVVEDIVVTKGSNRNKIYLLKR